MSDLDGVAKYIVFVIIVAVVTRWIYSMVDTLVRKLIIRQESLMLKQLSDTDILYFKDINRFAVEENGSIRIIPTNQSREPLIIPKNIEKLEEVTTWLRQILAEKQVTVAIDQKMKEEEERLTEERKEILTNPDFGTTPQVRAANLIQSEQLVKYLNFASLASCLWITLYPRPYKLSIVVAIILPLLLMGMLVLHKGLIRIGAEDEKSAYPSLYTGLILPGTGLMLRAILDFEILRYANWLWFELGVTSLVISLVLLRYSKQILFKKWSELTGVMMVTIMMYAYLFGVYIMMNCEFDNSKPVVFHTRVADKSIKKDKRTTYYLKLEAWGPKSVQENVTVAEWQYNETAVGDSVKVYLSPGMLKSSWFYVSKK